MISLLKYIFVIFSISAFVYTIIVPIRMHFNLYHGQNPYTQNINKNILLWLIRVSHLSFVLFLGLYILFFNKPRYDWLYVLLTGLMIIHWKLYNGECILDFYEKKLLDPNYVSGSNIYDHIYVDLIYPHFLFIAIIFAMITLVIIIYRSQLYIEYKIIIGIIVVYVYIRNLINRPIEYFI